MKSKIYFKLKDNIEKILFFVLLLLHGSLVFLHEFFLTVDGPSHLYNALLLKELINDSDSHFHQFYLVNSFLLPNSTGHYLLVFLLNFFTPVFAEKLIISMCVLLLPLSIRFMLKQISPSNVWLSILVFPFAYSFLLFFGFYNFLLALSLSIFTITLVLKAVSKHLAFINILIFFILFSLIYLSHSFVFMFTLLCSFIIFTDAFLSSLKTISSQKTILQNVLFIGLSAIPASILLLIFQIRNSVSDTTFIYLSLQERLSWLIGIQPAKAVSFGKESNLSPWLFVVFVGLLLSVLYNVFFRKNKLNIRFKWTWFSVTVILLLLFFILPDGNVSAGFISSRILLLFFIFLIIFLSSFQFHKYLKLISIFVFVYVSLAMLRIYDDTISKQQNICRSVKSASEKIEPYSTLAVLNNNRYFLYAHISSYLGILKPLILLNNYEAELDYFPVRWNYGSLPNYAAGQIFSDKNCFEWAKNEKNEKREIDYLFLINSTNKPVDDDCFQKSIPLIEKNYLLIYSDFTNGISLYKKL